MTSFLNKGSKKNIHTKKMKDFQKVLCVGNKTQLVADIAWQYRVPQTFKSTERQFWQTEI